jgi:hypothetical protein
MWESVEAISFVKVNKLSDVEEKPGLYKIVNKNAADKIYIGNAFKNLRSALTVNIFHSPGREVTNDLLKDINALRNENKNPEDYFDIYVCYQEDGGERFDLIRAKRLLIAELQPYYNYKGKPAKPEPEPEVVNLSDDYVDELKRKMADITGFLEKNHPQLPELYDLIVLALQFPNASSISSLVKSVGRDFMLNENETFVFKQGKRALGTSKKYVSWIMADGSSLTGMGTDMFVRRVRDVMNSRYDIEHGDKQEVRDALKAFIDSLQKLRKNYYTDSEFSYDENELKIRSEDFSVLNDKPWVIELVFSKDEKHQGLIISNEPGRQPLNKRAAVIIK